jgi:hypothetical protein
MATDYGTGVSRTLTAIDRQFGPVVWQKGKPPLDSELNLMSQIDWERFRLLVKGIMPSGFLLDPTRAIEDFEFNPLWANLFSLGNPKEVTGVNESDELQPVIWANVNGWVIPVAGTDITEDGDVRNFVKLYPPPSSDTRVDFVFLEAWQTLVAPNPSTANKPSASEVYKYGNVKYGGSNMVDDLEDPTIGFETTERVQVQYRLRVYGSGVGLGAGIALDVYPDGLDDPNVLGQGTASSPVAGFQFTNMREELGDPGLWRAGDGDADNDLGTVDGYVYAIPVAAIFRRNSNVYVAVNGAGNPDQNGAFERTPGSKLLANPLQGSRILLQATLTSDLSHTAGDAAAAVINVTNLNGSGLEDGSLTLSSTFLVIDDEVIGISAVDTVNGQITIPAGGRGRYGTAKVGHAAGTEIHFFNTRDDGAFADEVRSTDVLDLRRGVNPGDWDYARILEHNVAALVRGDLRTTWKQSAPGDTEGPVVHEVDYLLADGGTAVPNHTEALDGPDGIRQVWSDGASIQPDVTVLIDNEATKDANNGVGLTVANGFDNLVRWDVAPDFNPTGFVNIAGAADPDTFTNGSVIFMHIGGNDGSSGARGTFRDGSTKDVRFVTPMEYWKSGYPNVDPNNGNQYPVTLRFLDERSHEPIPPTLEDQAPAGQDYNTRHPGPMFPWREENFERPFIVLGGLLNSALRVTGLAVTNLNNVAAPVQLEIDVGINFDTAGSYYSVDANGDFETDPSAITGPVLRGERTLFDMLTNYGKDRTGDSSEVYVVVHGDKDDLQNNGAFKVVGLGTVGYTNRDASNATSIVVEPLSADFTPWNGVTGGFDDATGNSVTVEFRSQYHNATDQSDWPSRIADLAIVLTDLQAVSDLDMPWSPTNLGDGTGYDLTFGLDANHGRVAVASKAVVGLTLMYHPGRAGMARVPDDVTRLALRGAAATNSGSYLQQNKTQIDTTFAAASGVPTDEAPFDPVHVQTWNRLPSKGWHAPLAPNYGGNIVGFTEQDRENQAFYDKGSKTLIFRPFRDREMTLKATSWTGGVPITLTDSFIGGYNWDGGSPKDPLSLWTGGPAAGKKMAYAVPREYMPRFGRQDIPYYVDTLAGAGSFLSGINHLFLDKTDDTEPVFEIIGGEDNVTAGNEVTSFHFITNEPGTNYGDAGTVPAVANTPFIGARKVPLDIAAAVDAASVRIKGDLAAVNSSDLGRGLKGIQLPPFYGPARIYGVYERGDWEAQGGDTFAADRITPLANPATNLLREDAQRQTLFILKDGGEDLTAELDDHTYIIPDNAIDVRRIPGFDPATESFDSYEYVVECVVFGFAKGFINKNNFVLSRNHNGAGVLRSDGDDLELEGVHMVLPCAAGLNDNLFIGYNRTVYQGDVFMSRNGETRTTSDYEHRYGPISAANQHSLKTAIQQFDANGNFIPQTPNARAFQVLASMDFYTTLGTGKVGGDLFPGTMLDVGYTENSPLAATRLPADSTDPAWRILTRAFSEGQKTNVSRAKATLEILSNESMEWANDQGGAFRVNIKKLDGTVTKLYGVTSTRQAAFLGQTPPGETDALVAADLFEVDYLSIPQVSTISFLNQNFGTLTPKDQTAQIGPITKATWDLNDEYNDTAGVVVVVNPTTNYGQTYGGVTFIGRVDNATQNLYIEAIWTASYYQFDAWDDDSVREVTHDFGLVASGGSASHNVVLAGVTATDIVLVQPEAGWTNGLIVHGVANAGSIDIIVTNPTAAGIDPPSSTFKYVIISDHDADAAGISVDLSAVNLNLMFTQLQGSKNVTADNLVAAINAHEELGRTITAFNDGTPKITLEAVPTGAEGNGITIEVDYVPYDAGFVNPAPAPTSPEPLDVEATLKLAVPKNNKRVGGNVTKVRLRGGEDMPINAGPGSTQLRLTGMTERLPLGALLQDSDFLGENPFGDVASAMQSFPANIRPLQNLLPMTNGGEEYTRFLGAPGELIGMADGTITTTGYLAYTTATPTGSKRFRLFRGGGSAFVLSGQNPGGPIDWVSYSFPASQKPVLKGGILSCKALLVRNFYEEAFSGPYTVSEGDEIQMVIITHGQFGNWNVTKDGFTLEGSISPAGYGEGYAAADRYRCHGRPMSKGFTRHVPNPATVTLAVYDENTRVAASDAAAELTVEQVEDRA